MTMDSRYKEMGSEGRDGVATRSEGPNVQTLTDGGTDAPRASTARESDNSLPSLDWHRLAQDRAAHIRAETGWRGAAPLSLAYAQLGYTHTGMSEHVGVTASTCKGHLDKADEEFEQFTFIKYGRVVKVGAASMTWRVDNIEEHWPNCPILERDL